MAEKKKNISRADYRNAEEQIMRSEVMQHPLLPLYEAIHNAIHASIEDNLENIVVDVRINRNESSLSQDIAQIDGFTVTDYGIGFTDEKAEAFFSLFTTNKKDLFNSKGIGRLAFFSAFRSVSIESIFIDKNNYMERNFSVTISSIGTDDIPAKKHVAPQNKKTVVKIYGLEDRFLDKYYLTIDAIINKIRECFAAAILSLPSLIINIYDGEKCFSVDKNNYITSKGESLLIYENQFEIYYIKEYKNIKGHHEIQLAAAGRAVKNNKIAFLSQAKIGKQGEEKFYLKVIVISRFLDQRVNATRTNFNGILEKSDFENIFSYEKIYITIESSIRKYLEREIPESVHSNDKTISDIVEELPHLTAVSEEQEILNQLPLYSSPEKVRSKLVQEYASKQVEALNYVKSMASQYEKDGAPNFEDFWATESKKLRAGLKLNHAHLATYVMYREFIINLFSQFLKKREDGKYSPESVLHNLIFPMRSQSDSWEVDYHKHNLWLFDDRYASYNYLYSDKKEGSISGKKCLPEDKRYDIIAIYEDPHGAAQNVFLVELKQTHKELSAQNDPIGQLIDYTLRIKDGKLNKEDGGRINITSTTTYHGIILCDIHCEYFKKYMIDRYSLTQRSDGKSYYTIQCHDILFIEITNYENLLSIAQVRNKAFIEKLKGL